MASDLVGMSPKLVEPLTRGVVRFVKFSRLPAGTSSFPEHRFSVSFETAGGVYHQTSAATLPVALERAGELVDKAGL